MSSNYAESCTATLSVLGQCLVELQPSNTKALLQEASRQIQERQSMAEATLIRLKKLNPDIERRFTPKQEAISRLQLRLISSPTTEEQKPPTTFTSFIIVSYCWHNPSWDLAPKAQSVAPGWEVSKPMVDTVMRMRQGPEEGVWLDKMCINQADTADKTVHIGTMDVIYRSARRIVIFLEDVQLTAEEESAAVTYAAFYGDMGREVTKLDLQGQERLDYINNYFPSREEESTDDEELQKLRQGAQSFGLKMLSARWFSRAWCAHESRVTPHQKINNPLFLCYAADGRVLDFEFRFVHYLVMYVMEDTVGGGPGRAPLVGHALGAALSDPDPKTLQQLWWRMTLLMPERGGPEATSALQHVVSALRADCSQKADLVSIALNTASVPLVFSAGGQYGVTTVEDVVWVFTMLVLAGDDVTPLFVVGGKLRVPIDDTGKTRLSWTINPGVGVVGARIPSPRIDTITAVTRDYIEMDLLVFESRPSTPTVASFEVATKMMGDFGLANLHQEAHNEDVKRSDALVKSEVERVRTELHQAMGGIIDADGGPLKQFIPMWLAHAMDCGLEWTLRFPDVMQAETEEWEPHGMMGDAADERLTEAARFLYNHFTTQADSSNASDRDIDSDIQRLTRFLTCVLDPRLAILTVNPRRVALGNGDYAMTTSTSNRAWVAIPAATAHIPAWQRRAWFLEPFDPSSEPLEEAPDAHLPDINMTLTGDESAEDVFPMLSSDFADQRRPRVEAGTWRMRRQEEIFGCRPLTGTRSGDAANSNGAVLYLERQRIYGAEDYDWRTISLAVGEFEKKHGRKNSSLTRAH